MPTLLIRFSILFGLEAAFFQNLLYRYVLRGSGVVFGLLMKKLGICFILISPSPLYDCLFNRRHV